MEPAGRRADNVLTIRRVLGVYNYAAAGSDRLRLHGHRQGSDCYFLALRSDNLREAAGRQMEMSLWASPLAVHSLAVCELVMSFAAPQSLALARSAETTCGPSA